VLSTGSVGKNGCKKCTSFIQVNSDLAEKNSNIDDEGTAISNNLDIVQEF
jgi:hypothetical protein